jgi:hypothetical protein
MRVVYEYSHLGGSEILHMRYPMIEEEINRIIGTKHPQRSKISKAKTSEGKALFSLIDMNTQFKKRYRASQASFPRRPGQSDPR